METKTSSIPEKHYSADELISGSALRANILAEIRKDMPSFDEHGLISLSKLNYYRHRYIENTLREELGSISALEQDVLDSIQKGALISENVDEDIEQHLTFGQRMADRIADFGGSWRFILLFLGFALLWMVTNATLLVTRPFDPYPFILLNLVLSCVAAIQAPIIMMSQNRMESRDRERSKHDYKVNLKAELEIRILNEKIDHLILSQQQKLLEIQEIQIEMMKDIMDTLSRSGRPACSESEERDEE